MTYKAIVKAIINQTARKWVYEILDENNIEYWFIDLGEIELDSTFDKDSIRFNVPVSVYNGMTYKDVKVGGIADADGVTCCTIWGDKSKLLWISSQTTRDQLGIEKLEL